MEAKHVYKEWRVPRVRLEQFHREIEDEIRRAADEVLFENHWKGVQKITEAEAAFAEWRGAKYCSAVASGSAALQLALQGCDLPLGSEVIVPPNSDMSNYNTILIAGLVPVLCDVLASDYTMDIDRIEALITPNTSAIVPIDLYGHPANVKALRPIAERHGLKIIEDAALASYSRDYGYEMGHFADVTIFSTCGTKSMNACTFGGFLTTNDESVLKRANLFRGYGLDYDLEQEIPDISNHAEAGYNLQMHPMDAAIFLAKMPYMDRMAEGRRNVARWYEKYLGNTDGVILPSFRPESDPVMREYVVRIVKESEHGNRRNDVYRHLVEKGVQASLNYTPYIPGREMGKRFKFGNADGLPVSKLLSGQCLSLPCDPLLKEDEIRYVAESIIECLK